MKCYSMHVGQLDRRGPILRKVCLCVYNLRTQLQLMSLLIDVRFIEAGYLMKSCSFQESLIYQQLLKTCFQLNFCNYFLVCRLTKFSVDFIEVEKSTACFIEGAALMKSYSMHESQQVQSWYYFAKDLFSSDKCYFILTPFLDHLLNKLHLDLYICLKY